MPAVFCGLLNSKPIYCINLLYAFYLFVYGYWSFRRINNYRFVVFIYFLLCFPYWSRKSFTFVFVNVIDKGPPWTVISRAVVLILLCLLKYSRPVIFKIYIYNSTGRLLSSFCRLVCLFFLIHFFFLSFRTFLGVDLLFYTPAFIYIYIYLYRKFFRVHLDIILDYILLCT